MRMPLDLPQGRVPLDIATRQRLLQPMDVERLQRARNAVAVGTSHAGVRSPGIRQPWFASTMIAISGAHRISDSLDGLDLVAQVWGRQP